ncbi:MAG TPA: glycosyltransferase family 2 protein [Candidatus Peribacteraceae bacterium]|nr:glycosyltransferase family 2 protein [Candidatus Peribacteraceae bacterium]
MDQPLVNIYVPTYESKPEHLTEALECILHQTEKRWTVLVHDDCSKKDVKAVVLPYLEDARIQFIRSPVRLGIGWNWNACLKYGDAPFVQYLFQDDLWDKEYLARAIGPLIRDERVGFVSMDHRYQYEGEVHNKHLYEELLRTRRKIVSEGKRGGKEFLHMWIKRELHPNLIGEPSYVLFRRALMDTVGRFAEDMPQFLDEEYSLRCLLHADVYFVMEESGSFRVHAAGASAQNEQSGAGIYDRLRCFERLIALLPASDLKKEAVAARNRALETMAKKFVARMKSGKKIPGGKGAGSLKSLVLRHPILSAQALFKAWMEKK